MWDKSIPAGNTKIGSGQSRSQILANNEALEAALSDGHDFSTDGTQTGEHTIVTFNAPLATPDEVENKGILYPKDFLNILHLFFMDESGNDVPFTKLFHIGQVLEPEWNSAAGTHTITISDLPFTPSIAFILYASFANMAIWDAGRLYGSDFSFGFDDGTLRGIIHYQNDVFKSWEASANHSFKCCHPFAREYFIVGRVLSFPDHGMVLQYVNSTTFGEHTYERLFYLVMP